MAQAKPKEDVPDTGCEGCTGTTGFLMVMLGVFTMMVLFDPALRAAVGRGMGYLLGPVVGFDLNGDGAGDFPVFTIAAAATITGIFSTVIRHMSTDWMRQAEVQKYMGAFNKEVRKAMKENKQGRVKQLNKMQPEVMKLQNSLMMTQMKQMVVTMLVAISIFTWIWQGFIPDLKRAAVSVPWYANVPLFDNPYLLPNWILLYSMFSIVISQIATRIFKVTSFKRTLEKEEAREVKQSLEVISRLESKLKEMEKKGMNANKFRKRLREEKELLESGDKLSAYIMAGEIEHEIDKEYNRHKEAKDMYKDSRKKLKIAKRMNYATNQARNLYGDAKKAFEKGDYHGARRMFSGFMETLDLHRKDMEEIQVDIMELEEEMEEMVSSEQAHRYLERAKKSLEEKEYEEARNAVKRAKQVMGKARRKFKQVKKGHDQLEDAMDDARRLGLDIGDLERNYEIIESLYSEGSYDGLVSRVERLRKELESRVENYKKAQEEVSFAKLVVANAKDYGVDTSDYESKVASAEELMLNKQYDKAYEIAVTVKKQAEDAKTRAKRKEKRR